MGPGFGSVTSGLLPPCHTPTGIIHSHAEGKVVPEDTSQGWADSVVTMTDCNFQRTGFHVPTYTLAVPPNWSKGDAESGVMGELGVLSVVCWAHTCTHAQPRALGIDFWLFFVFHSQSVI